MKLDNPAPTAPAVPTEATVKNGDKLTVSGEQITLAVANSTLTYTHCPLLRLLTPPVQPTATITLL